MKLEASADSDSLNINSGHVPVMLEQATALLNVRPGLTYVDATAGGGSHLKKIVDLLNGQGLAIGLDRDPAVIANLKQRFQGSEVKLVKSNFGELEGALSDIGFSTVTGGILADLGISSIQLNDPARGFSFLKDGPLDMRMDTEQSLTAADLVNDLSERDLADIIFQYGEERESRAIAKRIVRARPFESTCELAEVIASGKKSRHVSRTKRHDKGAKSQVMHPATRTFQALRIAVNGELESLKQLLESSRNLLAPGARLVVITFHSLEDRLVKHFFRRMAMSCVCPSRQPVCTCRKKPEFLIITRKPFVAEEKEVLANIRSRSAKLRAGEKLP